MGVAAGTEVLARADAAASLPRLGGMARPNGVVIVSERYWAFAAADGSVHEGELPRRDGRAARLPLLRGLLQLGTSLTPLLRGQGVARRRERVLLLAALTLPFLLLLAAPPSWEAPAGAAISIALVVWLMRGRTLRLHGAEHRAIAAAEARSLGETWAGRARPSRISARCGTNFAALALPLTVVFQAAIPLAAASVFAAVGAALLALAVSMELWKAVQHPSGLLRGLLIPGMALQRLTTREPALADTQLALRAVAAVLRREGV